MMLDTIKQCYISHYCSSFGLQVLEQAAALVQLRQGSASPAPTSVVAAAMQQHSGLIAAVEVARHAAADHVANL